MPKGDYQKIVSSQNAQIKLLEKLNIKKYREQLKQFLVENLAIILDGLNDNYDFEALFVTEEFMDKHPEKLAYIESKSQCQNYYLIDSKLNKQYSSLDTPSGITAIYSQPDKKLDESSVVYLNSINDPGNLGAIMRSALAFDFRNLVLDDNCVDIYNPKVISAAKEAIFKLNIIEDKTGAWLADNKLPVYVTSSHQGDDLAVFKPAKLFCLVLGSESHGVSSEIMKIAKANIKINISAQLESLNVATAAAILFYELRR